MAGVISPAAPNTKGHSTRNGLFCWVLAGEIRTSGLATRREGSSTAAIALYRLIGALNSVLEHANIRVPRWVDRIWAYFWVTPDMHKVHHSRERVETDSNYANLFSFFDRILGTFTFSTRGTSVEYGIRGYEAAEHQSIGAALCLPFRRKPTIAVTGERDSATL